MILCCLHGVINDDHDDDDNNAHFVFFCINYSVIAVLARFHRTVLTA